MKKSIAALVMVVFILVGCGRGGDAAEDPRPSEINASSKTASLKIKNDQGEKSTIVSENNRYTKYESHEPRLSESGKIQIVHNPKIRKGWMNRGKLNELPIGDSFELQRNDIRGKDLTEMNLEDEYENLIHMKYSTNTKWPETLPEGFNPEEIIEQGKNPGLAIRELHDRGITGKGVGIAIIDQALDVEHVEYKDRLKMYEEMKWYAESYAEYHGNAVASLAVGKDIGVAPEADLYYIACKVGYEDESGNFVRYFGWLRDSINRIISINRELPEDSKIRVIALSLGFHEEQNEYWQVNDAIQRAEEEGIHVIYIGGQPFHGMGRNHMEDPDDPESYKKGAFWEKDKKYAPNTGDILFPMDSRTIAGSGGHEEYTYCATGGLSWVSPYVAGMYALACQVDPEMTPEKFWKKAKETAYDPSFIEEGYEYPCVMVNPERLIKGLENDKNAENLGMRVQVEGDFKTVLSPEGKLCITSKPNKFHFYQQINNTADIPKFDIKSNRVWQVDLRSRKLGDFQLKNRYDDLINANFDTKTVWPESLPENFKLDEIMEYGKNPGLGVRALHKKGIKGKGVGIAIIDATLLVDHEEYGDRVKMYEEVHNVQGETAGMHGVGVASIALGKSVGVAPEADLYFIACYAGDFSQGRYIKKIEWIGKSIDRIVEVNKTLPEGEKIRVISISLGIDEGSEKRIIAESVQRAEEDGIHVINIGSRPFLGLGRDSMKNPEDIESYEEGYFLRGQAAIGFGQGNLLVPMDGRTLGAPNGKGEYAYFRYGAMSWTAPYVAGLYALACQVNPEITPDEFWKVAIETGDKADFYGEECENPGRIVNPERLMEAVKKMLN